MCAPENSLDETSGLPRQGHHPPRPYVPLPQSFSEVVVWDDEEAQTAKRLCAAPTESAT